MSAGCKILVHPGFDHRLRRAPTFPTLCPSPISTMDVTQTIGALYQRGTRMLACYERCRRYRTCVQGRRPRCGRCGRVTRLVCVDKTVRAPMQGRGPGWASKTVGLRHSKLYVPHSVVQYDRSTCVLSSFTASYTDSLRSKLLWWHYHIWVDKATYDAFATAIVHHSLQADPSWTPHHLTDFDICTTFIARCVSKRVRYYCSISICSYSHASQPPRLSENRAV